MKHNNISVDDVLDWRIKATEEWETVSKGIFSSQSYAQERMQEIFDKHRTEARQELYDLISSEAETYTVRVNKSDGYEVTERAVPLEAIRRLFNLEKDK